MSAADVIEQIQKLPGPEQQKVADFLHRLQSGTKPAETGGAVSDEFKRIADEVFTKNAELMVESALGAAQNTYWYGRGDLFDIAAAYAFHIAESQAFVDGNKRTAAASAISFLTVNGVSFPKDDGSVYRAMIEIANKQLDKPGLAKILRRLTGTTE